MATDAISLSIKVCFTLKWSCDLICHDLNWYTPYKYHTKHAVLTDFALIFLVNWILYFFQIRTAVPVALCTHRPYPQFISPAYWRRTLREIVLSESSLKVVKRFQDPSLPWNSPLHHWCMWQFQCDPLVKQFWQASSECLEWGRSAYQAKGLVAIMGSKY